MRRAHPAPPVGGSGCCRTRYSTRAVAATIRGHQGMLLRMRTITNNGPFCRTCGTALNRDMTSKTLVQGWWSIGSLIMGPFALISNLVQRSKIRKLPPPAPGFSGRPLDPGKPVLRRPAVLGLLVPVAIVAIIAGVVVASQNDASHAEAGDCVKKTGENSIEIVECTSPGAEYKVLSRSSGSNDTLCQFNEQAVASYVEETSGSSFVLCLADIG